MDINKSSIFLAICVAAVLAVLIAPAVVESASAAIRDACEKTVELAKGIVRVIPRKIVRMM